jgi:hypothetical protein
MDKNTNSLSVPPTKPLVTRVALALMILAGIGLAYFFFVKLVADSLINPINSRDRAMAVLFIPISFFLLFLWFKTMAFLWKGASSARLALFVFAFLFASPIIIASGVGHEITFNMISPVIVMALLLILFFLPQSHKWFKATQEYRENKSQADTMAEIKTRYPNIDSYGPSERAKMLRNYMNEKKLEFKNETAMPVWASFLSSIGFAIVCIVIKAMLGAVK